MGATIDDKRTTFDKNFISNITLIHIKPQIVKRKNKTVNTFDGVTED